MFGAVLSALRSVVGWLLGQAVLKGVVLSVIAVLLVALGQWLWGMLPDYFNAQAISSALGQLPAGVWWVLDLFRVTQGLALVLSASVIAFLIRRLPVVG